MNKELNEAMKSNDETLLWTTVDDNLYKWEAYIKGPPDSPFEHGWFRLDFQVPQNYPIECPKVKMITKCYHPNIHFGTGEICLDILKSQNWSPAWTLESLCRAIVNLLGNPNADSPLNCDPGNQIRAGDMLSYETMARMYCVEYAQNETLTAAAKILAERYASRN